MLSRRSLLGTAIVLAGGSAVNLQYFRSRDEPRVYTGIVKGVAIGGYDPVAYFTDGAPTPGRDDITIVHDGATWRFASESNRIAFRSDPNRYAPRYGGYCAYAVAGGGVAGADPKVWRIVDGRLYLNASPRVHLKWEKDVAGFIKKGDANWPGALGLGT